MPILWLYQYGMQQEHVCKLKMDLRDKGMKNSVKKNEWVQYHFVVSMIGVWASRMSEGGFWNSCQRLHKKKSLYFCFSQLIGCFKISIFYLYRIIDFIMKLSFLSAVLRIEPRISCMAGTCSTIKPESCVSSSRLHRCTQCILIMLLPSLPTLSPFLLVTCF